MRKLLGSSIKQFFRDKQALFWSLAFPVIFLLVFSLFDFSGSVNARIIVIDRAQNMNSQILVLALQGVEGVGISKKYDDIDEAKKLLESADRIDFSYIEEGESIDEKAASNVILIIPENYGVEGNEQNFQTTLYYDESSQSAVSPVQIVRGIIDDVTLGISGQENPYATSLEGISVNQIKYFDILMPGILGMSIMQSGVIGIAASIAALKEKRVLKRISATPLAPWKFILAQVLTHLLVAVMQITIIIAMGTQLLGAHIYGNVVYIYILAIGGTFVFLNFGFIAATFAKTASAAEGLASAITTPMMFLSGVFFDRETLPEVVRVITKYLPLSPLIDALREVALRDKGLLDLTEEIAILGAWTLVTFLIAARMFKFREE